MKKNFSIKYFITSFVILVSFINFSFAFAGVNDSGIGAPSMSLTPSSDSTPTNPSANPAAPTPSHSIPSTDGLTPNSTQAPGARFNNTAPTPTMLDNSASSPIGSPITAPELFSPDQPVTPPTGFYDPITAPSVALPDSSADITKPDTSTLDYSGWVKCDGVVAKDANGKATEPGRTTECNFSNLINMAKLLINWLFGISIPIIIGILAYAGFLHITGKEADIKKSYEMIQKAVWGFVIMLMAWFIVTTLLKWVLNSDFTNVAGTLIDTQK